MHSGDVIKLIFMSKEFIIPDDIRILNDVNSDIYTEFLENHQYVVKSKVSEKVFQSFIDHWFNQSLPDITPENISEFELLSEEFGRMKDIIQLTKKYNAVFDTLKTSNQYLEQKISEIRNEKDDQFAKNVDIYETTLINTKASPYMYDNFYYAFLYHDINAIDHLTQKKFEHESGIICILDEKRFTAGIQEINSCQDEITIPRTIIYELRPYLVTYIQSFLSLSDQIKSVKFAANSEVQIFEDRAFKSTSIEIIQIPSSVTQIGQECFKRCKKLRKIEFAPNSKLQVIGNDAFDGCSLEIAGLPSSVHFEEDWCRNAGDLVFSSIAESGEKNILLDEETNFLLGKSSPKSDTFDVLLYAPKSIKDARIPSHIKHIAPHAFENSKLERIHFPSDSQLLSIGSQAFSETSLSEISIPSTVIDLKPKWCSSTQLNKVEVHRDNPNFKLHDGKFILGRSDPKSDTFDVLLFAPLCLTDAVIPSFIKEIGPYAFESSKIKKVDFADQSELRLIGNNAFSDSELESIQIPPTVVKIDDSAFEYCETLEKCEFFDNSQLQMIGKRAFEQTAIKEIKIPQSVCLIDDEAFLCCSKLSKADLPTELEVLGKGAFNYANLTEVTIPPKLSRINDGMFCYCENLQTVNIPINSKLKVIGSSAFLKTALEKITIPKTVEIIDSNAFTYYLQSVEFDEESELKIIKYDAFYFSALVKVKIPRHVTRICEKAFSNCPNLQVVEFSEHSELKSIEKRAFSQTIIESISIPDSVSFIGEAAFEFDNDLTKIEFSRESKLHTIEDNALPEKLKSITLPSSVSNLMNNLFYYPSDLSDITIFEKEVQYIKYYENSLILGKTNPENDVFDTIVFARRDITDVTIPSFIKVIKPFAFAKSTLSTVIFPDDSNLEIIEESAFAETKLKNVCIPPSVTYVGKNCFYLCQSLEVVEFVKNCKLKTICELAFSGTAINKLVIPSNVCDLQNGWLNGTALLKNITIFENGQENISSLGNFIIGKSNIQSGVFDSLLFVPRDIKSITVPSFIKRIVDDAFSNCSKLFTVNFTADIELETIGRHSFDSSNITHISIPKSVKEICDYAFGSCKNLYEINFEEESELKSIGEHAFDSTNLHNFCFPPHVTKMGKSVFDSCKIVTAEIAEDSELRYIDMNIFNSDTELMFIPPNLRKLITIEPIEKWRF